MHQLNLLIISVIKFQIHEIKLHISENKLLMPANLFRYLEWIADISNKIQISVFIWRYL